ncbi:MAG: phosphoribosyltransferase [Oligoflexales bacterium]
MNFHDRHSAGKVLGAELRQTLDHTENTFVLGIVKGGVPIAYEVAKELGISFHAFVVNKIVVPGHSQVAIGAVAPEDTVIINRSIADELQISSPMIKTMVEAGFESVWEGVRKYNCGDYARLPYSRVVLVDDGVATGASMKAAAQSLRRLGVTHIHVGVPVAAREGCETMRSIADAVTCLNIPEPFFSVEHWYDDFSPVTDEEVYTLLKDADGCHSRKSS